MIRFEKKKMKRKIANRNNNSGDSKKMKAKKYIDAMRFNWALTAIIVILEKLGIPTSMVDERLKKELGEKKDE